MLAYQGFETGVFVFILCLDGGLRRQDLPVDGLVG